MNKNNNNNGTLGWNEIAKSKKGTRTNYNQTCWNILSEYDDKIVILEGIVNHHEYVAPKSKVSYYDGCEVHLRIQYNTLSTSKVKENNGSIFVVAEW